MVKASSQIIVAAHPQQVYDFVVVNFEHNYPRWSPEVKSLEMLTPGPLRVGSRARQVRVDQGRQSKTIFRVTALEPLSRVSFAESTDQFRTEYRIEPVGEQARLFFTFELRRIELYMRPFEKLIRVAIDDGARRVVESIKGLIEREPPR